MGQKPPKLMIGKILGKTSIIAWKRLGEWVKPKKKYWVPVLKKQDFSPLCILSCGIVASNCLRNFQNPPQNQSKYHSAVLVSTK